MDKHQEGRDAEDAQRLAPTVSDGNYSGRKEATCAHKIWVRSGAPRWGDWPRQRHTQRAPWTSSTQNARVFAHTKQKLAWRRDMREASGSCPAMAFVLALVLTGHPASGQYWRWPGNMARPDPSRNWDYWIVNARRLWRKLLPTGMARRSSLHVPPYDCSAAT